MPAISFESVTTRSINFEYIHYYIYYEHMNIVETKVDDHILLLPYTTLIVELV